MKIGQLAEKRGGPAQAASLIEVLVSILLVGLFIISLYGGLSWGFTVTQSTREELRATQILMQKIEAIRLCNWGQLSNCPIAFSEFYDPLGATNGQGGAAYHGTISTGPATEIPDTIRYKDLMLSVKIDVYWTNFSTGRPLPQHRSLESYASLPGLQNYIWGAY